MIMNKSQYKECIEQEIYAPYRNAKNRCSFLDKIWLKYICPESNALFFVRKKMYLESIGGVQNTSEIITRQVSKEIRNPC